MSVRGLWYKHMTCQQTHLMIKCYTWWHTLYEPRCCTWQERIASLPATTVLLSTSSVNSGNLSSEPGTGTKPVICILYTCTVNWLWREVTLLSSMWLCQELKVSLCLSALQSAKSSSFSFRSVSAIIAFFVEQTKPKYFVLLYLLYSLITSGMAFFILWYWRLTATTPGTAAELSKCPLLWVYCQAQARLHKRKENNNWPKKYTSLN